MHYNMPALKLAETWLSLNSQFLSPNMIIPRGIRPTSNHIIGLVFAQKVQRPFKNILIFAIS